MSPNFSADVQAIVAPLLADLGLILDEIDDSPDRVTLCMNYLRETADEPGCVVRHVHAQRSTPYPLSPHNCSRHISSDSRSAGHFPLSSAALTTPMVVPPTGLDYSIFDKDVDNLPQMVPARLAAQRCGDLKRVEPVYP